jgi:chromosome segregation ATPase
VLRHVFLLCVSVCDRYCYTQRQLTSMEGDIALLRSQNRQLSSLQAAYEREIVAHRQREVAIASDVANKDVEVGRLRAALDRVEMDKRSLKGELEASKDAKALVEEEVKLLRQSLATQELERLKRQVRPSRKHRLFVVLGLCR